MTHPRCALLLSLVVFLLPLQLSCSSSTAPSDARSTDGAGDGTGQQDQRTGDAVGGNACEAAGGLCGTTVCPAGYHEDPGELSQSNVCNPCPPGAPCARFPCCLPDGPDGGSDAATDAPSDGAAGDGAADPDPRDGPPAPDRAPVSCGTMTCGADEVCVVQCTCCGIPTDMAPSADYRCEPIPPGCLGDPDPCACGQIHCDFASTGSCPGGQRQIECPCA